MSNLAKFKIDSRQDAELWQLRVDLAAAFRLAAEMNWHESVGNHFSLAVSSDGTKFLMNPRWKHFSLIKASDLLFLDSQDPDTMKRPDAPDPSAWCIHGRIHANLPQLRCMLHLHPPHATALAALADPELKPIDQNTARFFNRMAIDLHGRCAAQPWLPCRTVTEIWPLFSSTALCTPSMELHPAARSAASSSCCVSRSLSMTSL